MSRVANALGRLESAIGGGKIFTDAKSLFDASIDNSRYSFLPEAVVKARNFDDISKTLSLANSEKIPVATRGAGSGCSGAALPVFKGIVLDLSAIDFIEIDPVSWTAHVGAGAVNAHIDEAAAKFSLMYPPDPSSKNYSTIGGNIACNAGGLRAAKYGTTRDYVMAMTVFLADGRKMSLSRPLRKFAVGMNLKDLFISSEGSLGVIAEAWLKLVKRPARRAATLAFFKSDNAAFACVQDILKSNIMPAVLEFMDAESAAAAAKFQGLEMPQFSVLLIELDGEKAEIESSQKILNEVLKSSAEKFEIAENEDSAEKLWQMRRCCSPAMFLLSKTKLNQDIVLPISKTAEFFDYFKKLGLDAGLPTPTFGHAADGNYHIHFMYDDSDAAQKRRAFEAMRLAIQKTIDLGGAISGEHGIGITKSGYIKSQIAEAEFEAMKKIKAALDPNGILNPQLAYSNFVDVSKFAQNKSAKLPWDKR